MLVYARGSLRSQLARSPALLEPVLWETLVGVGDGQTGLPLVLAFWVDLDQHLVGGNHEADSTRVEDREVVPLLVVPHLANVAPQLLVVIQVDDLGPIVEDDGDVPVLLPVLNVLEGVNDDPHSGELGTHAVQAPGLVRLVLGQPQRDPIPIELFPLPRDPKRKCSGQIGELFIVIGFQLR